MSEAKVVIALDFESAEEALALVAKLSPTECRLKVGKELFTLCGPELVRKLVGMGFDVFLDLKFHDIPNTVAKAVSAAAKLGVWMVNVHASGGRAMMEAAVAAIKASEHQPLLTAVTVLTSTSAEDLAELNQHGDLRDRVLHYATLAKDCGLDGVVCSAQESEMLKAALGANFKLITPGIRPVGADAGDQHRIVTPTKAIAGGSDYLVIGRPITKATDPVAALAAINQEIA